MLKPWKKLTSKFHFLDKLFEIGKKVMIQNGLLLKDLQV